MRKFLTLISYLMVISLVSCSSGSSGGDGGNGGDGNPSRDVNLSQALSAQPWIGSWEATDGTTITFSNEALTDARSGDDRSGEIRIDAQYMAIQLLSCTSMFIAQVWSNSLPSANFESAVVFIWMYQMTYLATACSAYTFPGSVKWEMRAENGQLKINTGSGANLGALYALMVPEAFFLLTAIHLAHIN